MQGGAGRTTTGPGIAGWARDALASMAGLPGVHRVGIALAEGGGRRLRFTASDRAGDSGPDWCHVDAYDDVPLNTAVRTGRPVLGGLGDLRTRYPTFVERQRGTPTAALAAIPISAAGQTLGAYVLFFDDPQPFDARQREQLTAAGDELGAALRAAQRAEDRPGLAPADEQLPAGARSAVHQVPDDLACVAEARRFLRRTLRDWGVDEDTTDTAVLCLSELVTNALVHAHAGCVVQVILDDGILTTTVRDNGAHIAGLDEPPEDPLRVHGRGLQLVDALTSRWGSQLDAVGTTVWFVLGP